MLKNDLLGNRNSMSTCEVLAIFRGILPTLKEDWPGCLLIDLGSCYAMFDMHVVHCMMLGNAYEDAIVGDFDANNFLC